MKKLEKAADPKKTDRRALVWDHETGEWVPFTEAELDKRWPRPPEEKAAEKRQFPQ